MDDLSILRKFRVFIFLWAVVPTKYPMWHIGMGHRTLKEKFNRKHSSIRNVNERSIGLLKMKRGILYRMKKYPMWKQK
jgi:hypothetical protein